MPITIVDPGLGSLTPYAQITAHTDIIGPIPIEWNWRISLEDATTEQVQLQQIVPTAGSRNLAHQWLDPRVTIIQARSPQFMDGANARLLLELVDQFSVVKESASTAVHYDTTTGLPVGQQLQQGGDGGLTEEQAVQLAATADTNAVAQLLDALTLTELTTGPSSGSFAFPLATVTFGVIVRLTAIPAELVPTTPDNEYWVKTLASVRVFRGSDMWFRVPIHTRTKIIPFEKEGLVVWVTNATLTQWLLAIGITVDFLPGVLGQVYQMHFP